MINYNRIDRFKDEIKASLKLEHPNIIKVFDFNYEKNPAYMVMAYHEKGNLTNLNLTNYSIEEKLDIFKKICEGVAYAHKNNVIHRDLKPENILLGNDFEPIITDFGLCFFTDSGERITLSREAVGSRYYMAPELEEGKTKEISYASDVYSLGKILYWLITGKVFSREKLHSDEFDITKDDDHSSFLLINEFLDNMIKTNSTERFKNGCVVLDELEILLKRIKMGANSIGYGIPQTCIYCGLGHYKKLPQTYDIGASVVRNFFNFRDDKDWTIFQCEYCNNLQIFRPMLKGSIDRWKKEKK